MIGQRAEPLSVRENIYSYGCYFMSIIMMCWEFEEDPTKEIGIEQIIKSYDALVASGAMGEDCYIKDPQACVDYWGKGILLFTGKQSADYDLSHNETSIELWRLERDPPKKWWYHFIYKSEYTEYDPWILSQTRAEGVLDSKRIFKIL